jgi:GNAT superfamily N-acetyltransferase
MNHKSKSKSDAVWQLRAPGPEDYSRVAELARQLGYPSTAEQIRSRLDGMRNSDQYAVYVAELPEGKVAGWIGVSIFRTVAVDPCAEINGLVVDSDVRSLGIGSALVGIAEEWARSKGCNGISVQSNVKRDGAHRFYERHGFQHIKTQKAFRKDLKANEVAAEVSTAAVRNSDELRG